MIKVSLQNGLVFTIIISVIILVILYVNYLRITISPKVKETFNDGDKIIIKNNFYDITPNNPILKTSTENNLGHKVGGVNLCIYETYNSKVTDVECITSGEFNNALALPKSRRETACIDEECIDLEDVKFLTGETPFQLKTFKTNPPTQKNYKSEKCLGKNYIPIYSCKPYNYSNNNGGKIL
jgi:hypothetical protein